MKNLLFPTMIIVGGLIVWRIMLWKSKPISTVPPRESDEMIADYQERTGRSMPSYEEMIMMTKEEVGMWTVIRVDGRFRDALLQEMIEHEEKTGSFRGTKTSAIGWEGELLLNLFNRTKSAEIAALLEKTKRVLVDGVGEQESDVDLIMEAIMAKSASDWAIWGKK